MPHPMPHLHVVINVVHVLINVPLRLLDGVMALDDSVKQSLEQTLMLRGSTQNCRDILYKTSTHLWTTAPVKLNCSSNRPLCQNWEYISVVLSRAVKELAFSLDALKFHLIVESNIISNWTNLVARQNFEDATFWIGRSQFHLWRRSNFILRAQSMHVHQLSSLCFQFWTSWWCSLSNISYLPCETALK